MKQPGDLEEPIPPQSWWPAFLHHSFLLWLFPDLENSHISFNIQGGKIAEHLAWHALCWFMRARYSKETERREWNHSRFLLSWRLFVLRVWVESNETESVACEPVNWHSSAWEEFRISPTEELKEPVCLFNYFLPAFLSSPSWESQGFLALISLTSPFIHVVALMNIYMTYRCMSDLVLLKHIDLRFSACILGV